MFSAEIGLAYVLGADEAEIVKCLSGPLEREHCLVSAQRVERATGDLAVFCFRCDLIQRYLYGRLDAVAAGVPARGRCGWTRIGARPGGADDLAVRLAWHCEAAGTVDKAVTYLHRAGDLAARLQRDPGGHRTLRTGLGIAGNAAGDRCAEESGAFVTCRPGPAAPRQQGIRPPGRAACH